MNVSAPHGELLGDGQKKAEKPGADPWVQVKRYWLGVWCGQRPGRCGWDPAMQPALTDALYIACHFILGEYWGVARLKPAR